MLDPSLYAVQGLQLLSTPRLLVFRRHVEGNISQPLGEAREGVLEDGQEKPVLAPEVMLHRPPRDAGACDDHLGRRALYAELGDAVDDRLDQAPARLGRALGVRASAPRSVPRTYGGTGCH